MSLTRRLLANRHTVWALAVAAAIYGTVAYLTLPMQLFPDTAPPMVNVVTPWPGASASDVADGLLPLEQEAAALEGIVRIRSTAQDNLSLLSLEFAYGRDVALAAVDVQNAVARVRDALPRGIREPQVLRFSSSDRPVITLGVAGEDLMQVRRLAEDVLAPRLQQVSGVAAVDVFGGAAPGVVVEVDGAALEAHRVPLAQVVAAVRSQNAALPAGRLRTDRTETLFRVESRSSDLAGLAATPLVTADGAHLRLEDLAGIREGALDDDARFAIDGERAIALQVVKATDANTVEVVHAVRAAADELATAHPGLRFQVGEESASFTETVVDNLLQNVWQALLLASALIFLFLGTVRTAFVAVVSMPLSYALTFAAMKLLGIDLDMVTLTAVILSVGMVVDASVVVLENITRIHQAEGGTPDEAAVRGTDEVRLAVLAGAGTTLVVLVPLLFLEGFTGKTFGPLAATLALAFASSIVVALVFVPVLTAGVTGPRTRADRLAGRLVRPFTRAMDGLRRAYLWILDQALEHRGLTVALALLAFAGGVVGLRLLGLEVLPKMDGGQFYVALETPSGTSLEQTERVVREVEAILAEQPEVVKVQSQVGFEPGMATTGAGVQGATQGYVTVLLTPRTEREDSLWEIQGRVRARIDQVPGIRSVVVRELGNTAKPTTTAPVVVRLGGPDPLVLDRLGAEVLAAVARVPGVVEPARSWRLDQVRTRVEVDALRAGHLGLSPEGVGALMQAGSEGVSAGEFHDGRGTPLPLRVRYARPPAPEPRDLLAYPIVVPALDHPVPLRTVARLEETVGQGMVTREDLQPTLEVTAFLQDRPMSFVVAEVEAALGELIVPQGYEVRLTGEKQDLAEARGQIGAALGAAVLGVYLLLVAQFRSWLHPLTVLLAVPLSLAGVAGALALAGKAVSMPVMVALVLLVGTVVNNAILLVDFIARARATGVPRRDALRQAVDTRFRPIMMTSLSTMIGMTPLALEWALGAERFSPLATAVIGGLATATLLTMVVIPVLYDLFDGLQARSLSWLGRVAVVGLLGATLGLPTSAVAQTPVRLDLEEVLIRARRHSLALRDEADAVAAAEHRHRETVARSLPRLDLQARASRLSEVPPARIELPQVAPGVPPPEPVTLGESVEDQVGLRATLSQPLFAGFGLTHQRRAAAAAVDLARSRRAVSEADLELEATETFFRVVQARETRAVFARSVDTVRGQLRRVEALSASGRTTRLEVARLRGRLAEVQAGLEQATGAEEVATLVLLDLVGLPDHTPLDLAAPLDPSPPPVAAPSDAPPDLAVARHAAARRTEEARAAAAPLWPQLSLVLGANYDRPNQRYFPPENTFHGTWDASVVLSWTAFDFGARRHAAAAARLEGRRAERAVADASRRLRLAEAGAARESHSAHARVAAGQAAVTAADEALRLATALFEAGRLDATALSDREVDRTRAAAGLVAAKADARVAEARLVRLRGSGPAPVKP